MRYVILFFIVHFCSYGGCFKKKKYPETKIENPLKEAEKIKRSPEYSSKDFDALRDKITQDNQKKKD